MGIQVGDNFEHKSKKFLDGRTQYATLADMKAVSDSNIPEGFEAYCVATDKYYKFLSSNTVDSTTGKWRERESGGASTLTDLTDTTISSPSNGQVLAYDSATSKWKNSNASGGASSLNELSDVTITSATSGQVLLRSGSNWVNGNIPSDDTKQPKTLDTPLVISGATYTTVESALAALKSNTDLPSDFKKAEDVQIADFEGFIKQHYFQNYQTYIGGDYYLHYNLIRCNISENSPNGTAIQTCHFHVYCKGIADATPFDNVRNEGVYIDIVCIRDDGVNIEVYIKTISKSASSNTWSEGTWSKLDVGSSTLNDLSDVAISSASNGQVLKHNGTSWVNGTVPSDDTKQSKALETPLTIDGASVTTVEGALGALNGIMTANKPQIYDSTVNLASTSCAVMNETILYSNTAHKNVSGVGWGGGYPITIPNPPDADYQTYIIVTATKVSSSTQDYWAYIDQIVYLHVTNTSSTTMPNGLYIYHRRLYGNMNTGSFEYYANWDVISGSLDTTKLYSTDDTASADLADADYVPFYDTSATDKKKTLWSNIKSVLKTYFDSLYSGIFTNATELAKIGEQNGVPTYDGQIISLPTVHNFDKANLYSTTEQVVGRFIDGRPLYQRTITFTTPSAATSPSYIEIGTIASNIDSIVAYSGAIRGTQYSCPLPYCFDVKATNPIQTGCYIDKSTGKLYLAWSNASGSYASMPAHYTIQYTKTTDAANSFNYASENDYSTSETIVGTWVDGSTLYQRTFTGTTNSTNGAKAITTLSSGYTVRRFFGTCHWGTTGTNGGEVQIPWISLSSTISNSEQVVLYTQGTTVYINQANMPSKEYKVTIQYTKS